MKYIVFLFALCLGGVACGSTAVSLAPTTASVRPTTTALVRPTVTVVTMTPTFSAPPAPTGLPTATATLLPTVTHTPTPTATATPIGPCGERVPGDDLLTIVTQQYGLGRAYVPNDLVPLEDYFSVEVTRGYPHEVREVVVEPLVEMVADMEAIGLQPLVLSGYRSFEAQALARQKWVEKEPERVDVLSARPGHSEHQLGTTIDFGSLELPEITGIADIEFHTYFYQTSEGQWLLENAHKYGFTLSYPYEAFELTGFYYEPWHYRYVGQALATELYETGMTLTAYQLANMPEPCIP